jgi:hypothetical protein
VGELGCQQAKKILEPRLNRSLYYRWKPHRKLCCWRSPPLARDRFLASQTDCLRAPPPSAERAHGHGSVGLLVAASGRRACRRGPTSSSLTMGKGGSPFIRGASTRPDQLAASSVQNARSLQSDRGRTCKGPHSKGHQLASRPSSPLQYRHLSLARPLSPARISRPAMVTSTARDELGRRCGTAPRLARNTVVIFHAAQMLATVYPYGPDSWALNS